MGERERGTTAGFLDTAKRAIRESDTGTNSDGVGSETCNGRRVRDVVHHFGRVLERGVDVCHPNEVGLSGGHTIVGKDCKRTVCL
jgi:hypothetical protein